MRAVKIGLSALIALALLSACSSDSGTEQQQVEPAETATAPVGQATAPAEAAPAAEVKSASAANPNRNAYFGDLHVHTKYSFDAFIFGTRATPDDAYNYARGGSLQHPGGFEMKLKAPLDFYAVTDHSMFLGNLPAMEDPNSEISKHPVAKDFLAAKTAAERRVAFQSMRPYLSGAEDYKKVLDVAAVKSAWQTIIASANRNNEPGKFTAFIGYEYTSGPESQNLHRNVIFKGDKAPEIPFGRLDSWNPEDLWTWMDEQRAKGMDSLAMPHNSNGSNGQMFKLTTYDGQELDGAYAEKRMRNEPLVEITQVKGTSDAHPILSPNDEWADFEIMPYRIATSIASEPKGSYVREAYMNGLKMEVEKGFNPYRFGVIGSSDTHNASSEGTEEEFYSKVGILDDTGQKRGSVPLDEPREDGSKYADTYYNFWSASGVAGVWAEENTRDSIHNAMRRKETFATSGPRIKVRFFGGYELNADLLNDGEMIAKAYAGGIPMGGDLMPKEGSTPSFLVWAMRDANAAPLQRIQIIKGWVQDGEAQEQVYDVACSDGGTVDPATHRCPDNGAKVNLTDCSISADVGAAELKTIWQDPAFDAAQHAFYYVRVLENPTCRWSTWDAIRAGVEPREDLHKTIQERAWSSPIWYKP
ncbi:MAG: DUF3604 domain-containing protein [Pseudomonadota bacterium]